MNKKKKSANEMIPGDIFHPGEHLKDELEARKMSQQQFCDKLGLSKSEVSSIIHGRRNISPVTALLFEKILGIDAEFWLNMQMKFDIDLVRKKTRAAIRSAKIPIARKTRFEKRISA